MIIVIEPRSFKKNLQALQGKLPTFLLVSAEAGEVESRVGDLQPMDDMDDMDDEDFDEDLYSANEIAIELGFYRSVGLQHDRLVLSIIFN